ncbi:NTPase [Candidatus Bathyarchaeota archaeon]|nr:NTPase [Candidatus Bathyarchaeota archaeon]
MQKRVLLLTGNPGVGKTTVLMKTVSVLKEKGCCVGGMISFEAREGGTRVGFEIMDLNSGRYGWLAHINQKSGPHIGKYRVNKEDLDFIGAKAIEGAVEKCAIIAIDEIGPMEIVSEKFKEATRKALEGSKPVVAVVHWKAHDKLINEAKSRHDSETFTVTQENRDKLPEIIAQKTLQVLK